MKFLTPDTVRTVKINTDSITIKEKIIPDSAKATKDLISKDCPVWAKKGMPMKNGGLLNDGTGIPRGITVHNTGDIKTPSGTNAAEQYSRATWPNCNMGGVTVHFYVYKNEIWQNLKETERGRHASDQSRRKEGHRKGQVIGGNVDTIAIECIGPSIESETTAQKLCAYLCNKYKLDPFFDIYTHNFFMGRPEIVVPGASKNCPIYILPHLSNFITGVQKYYYLMNTPAPPPKPPVDLKPPVTPPSVIKYYDVVTSLFGYTTAVDAKKDVSRKTTLAPDKYIIFREFDGMLNLTKTKNVPGSWVNPAMNKVAPKPVTPAKPVAPPKPKPTAYKVYDKGQLVKQVKNALYASSTTDKVSKLISGKYYAYDGQIVNGRIRVTVKRSFCGKKPVWMFVTGWVGAEKA